MTEPLMLIINPGSTSTKVALFRGRAIAQGTNASPRQRPISPNSPTLNDQTALPHRDHPGRSCTTTAFRSPEPSTFLSVAAECSDRSIKAAPIAITPQMVDDLQHAPIWQARLQPRRA
ncbi:MAG: hypothetical protein MZU97_04885 [Bacillus subtilis]|nr:hypothetical protein [Bacillus subtilis]